MGAWALRQKNGKFDPDSETTKIYVTPKGSRKRIKLKVVMRKELKVRAEMSETRARKQRNQQTKTWVFLKDEKLDLTILLDKLGGKRE